MDFIMDYGVRPNRMGKNPIMVSDQLLKHGTSYWIMVSDQQPNVRLPGRSQHVTIYSLEAQFPNLSDQQYMKVL